MRRALLAIAGVAGGVVLTAGPAFAATSGAQAFILTSHGRGQPGILATGPIHGAGTDQTVGQNSDRFLFQQGAVNVNHAATAQHPGPQAGCTFFYSERGTYQLAGGTGQYAGASGGGTYVLNDVFFAKTKPNGTCAQNAGHDVLLIVAHGQTTLPS